MIDFHSHILPGMDDGAEDVDTSLQMLYQSYLQGVDCIVATSHFYADEEFPQGFLSRREAALANLRQAMQQKFNVYPEILLGAEVLYFPGISEAEEIQQLQIAQTHCILIEPPMIRWTDSMLDDILNMGERFGCVPVIAHVDRYMNMLRDKTLIDRVRERDMLVQVNASYFLNSATVRDALRNLKLGKLDFIGSDCHNLSNRAPNLGAAQRVAAKHGLLEDFQQLSRNAEFFLRKQ